MRKVSNLLAIALFSCILSYDVASVYLQDLLIFLAVALGSKGLFRFSQARLSLQVFLLFFSATTISQCISLVQGKGIEPENFYFFVKQVEIFFLLCLFASLLESGVSLSEFFIKAYLATGFFLAGWVFLYGYLIDSGSLSGSSRVSFPFSRDYWYSDAHLYSMVLCLFLITLFLGYQGGIFKGRLVPLLALFTFIAMIKTGSRTGILCTGSAIFFNLVFQRRWSSLALGGGLAFIGFLFFFIYRSEDFFFYSSNYLNAPTYLRSINFDFASDVSALGRLEKAQVALDDASSSAFFLGVGPLSSSLRFYDGIFSILFAHGGLFLVFLYIFIVLLAKRSLYKSFGARAAAGPLSLIVAFFIGNAITEYVFVTRATMAFFASIYLLTSSEKMGGVNVKRSLH